MASYLTVIHPRFLMATSIARSHHFAKRLGFLAVGKGLLVRHYRLQLVELVTTVLLLLVPHNATLVLSRNLL